MSRLQLCVVLVAITLLSGCLSYKPRILPNKPELIIDENEKLEIICTSINEIKFEFPETDEELEIYTSEHKLIPENQGDGGYKTRFVRKEASFGDTGWYGCIDSKSDIPEVKDYNDPNASWIYVYVRSNESAFVHQSDFQFLETLYGKSVVLPCRPTSPHLHVKLSKDAKELSIGENVSFDPKKGFELRNLVTSDNGYYQCEIRQDNYSEERSYNLIIQQKENIKEPQIRKDGLEYVTTGSSLHIKCSAEISVGLRYKFQWITPRNSSTGTKLDDVIKPISNSQNLVISEYVENNVTFDDEGDYICRLQLQMGNLETKAYVNVHDSSKKFIKLSSHDNDRRYTINELQPVIFSAYVDGFPVPNLLWLGPGYTEVKSDVNVIIEKEKSRTTLKINRVRIEHTGVYTLIATNGVQEERLNFTLTVLAKPQILMDNVKIFYSYGKTEKFNCKIKSYPTSNTSWFYTKCSDIMDVTDCETYELEDHNNHEHSDILISTEVEVKVDEFGFIKCSACNNLGCDSAEEKILVTDGVADVGFGIVEPEYKVTDGDNITLMCAAAVYNYSAVQWFYDVRTDENDGESWKAIENNDRINITYEQTHFTNRAYLTIKDLNVDDQIKYWCKAKCSDCEDFNEAIFSEVVLEEHRQPVIISSNMNETEVTKTGEEAHNFNFTCFADGMPKPMIIWLQNNEPLKLSEKQYKLYNNSQVLVFAYLMEKDSGKFSCLVENRFGVVEKYQNVIVKGSERILKIFVVTIIALIITVIIILICCCVKIRREQKIRKQLTEAGLMHFEEGAPECLNPDLTVDDQADLLPYDRKWEFPREKLKLGKQLGSGAFGVVMKAEAYGICPEESLTTVAVKMVRRNAEPSYIRALASELKIMVHLGKHLNVVNLLGACTNNIAKKELLVIVEYCRFGNLHNYLLRHRESFVNQIDPTTGEIDPSIGSELLMRPSSIGSSKRVKYAALSFSRSVSSYSANTAPGTESVTYTTDTQGIHGLPNDGFINSNGSQPGWRSNYRGDYKERNLKPIFTQDLLTWAFQVASGMEYLSKRKVLHGDLAARNILLSDDNIVKICDFGLAKTMYKDDNYQKKGDGPVPLKWMAIESIRDRLFSTQSDIWSFGIVLWEFFTLAETPYPGMHAEQQFQRLVEGYRMEQPKYATKEIYEIMRQCWKAKPTLRPSFTDLVEDIGILLEENVKKLYEDLNRPYLVMNNADLEGKDDYLTMMSSPDHVAMSSPHEYVNNPIADSAYLTIISEGSGEGSKVSNSRQNSTQVSSRFQFPSVTEEKIANGANSDEDAPMLKKPELVTNLDEDDYLKPIDVHKKRENFVKQLEVEKKKEKEQSTKSLVGDRDSGYCNTPKGLDLIDIRLECEKNRNQNWTEPDETDTPPVILTMPDNYVNLPKQKSEGNKVAPDSYLNPSYVYAPKAD